MFGMLMVMLISQYAPFGKYSMLYSDMYHQYYPFFVAFRSELRSGNSLLYTWSVGLGMDYLGLISYYLASPLNLLSVLVPESWLLNYFSLLVPIKLGFAGLFFSLFLKNIFKRDDLSIALFGCFYGLCAWALGYQWNIMWLDTFALLPLVALGAVRLLRDKKFILYTVTLFFSIFINYYVGLFTCIFVLLLFICYEICRWQGFRRFFADLLRIALFSVLAIGMTAILELPTLAALQTTQSSVNKFPTGFRLNIADENTWLGLLDAMRQVAGNMNGALTPTFKEGLPNLYCGLLTNMLAVLFLTSRQVKLRDKLCSVALILFFFVSFIIRQLDYIWHGFHFTNMIPYRFSFLASFVLLYMAYRAFLLLRTFRTWQIILAGVVAIGLAVCSESRTSLVFWVYNGLFFVLYLGILLYYSRRRDYPAEGSREEKKAFFASRRTRRQYGSLVLTFCMVMELILTLLNFGLRFPGTAISNYPRGKEDTASMIRYMKEREEKRYDLFYRAETTHSQTLNDGALNGYYGVSTFTSSANVRVTEFMQALGYGAKNTYNRYCFEESSPVANLFLGLKYMIERDDQVEDNPYFDDLHHSGSVHLLENNAYLPLGFLANSQLINVDFENVGNRFSFQNYLLSAATGLNYSFWIPLPGSCTTIAGTDTVDFHSQTDTGYCSYDIAATDNGTITYSYTADREGFFCFDINESKKNGITVCKNGIELYTESYSLPQMLAVSQVQVGDVIEIRLGCEKGSSGTVSISAAILDEGLFRKAYDILAASTLELESFTNTRLTGTITCDRDGVLYTSIPQNGCWHVRVDGEEVQAITIGDAMVGVPLNEGTHTVRFAYRNDAFSLGWKISLGCLAVFLFLCFPKRRKKQM